MLRLKKRLPVLLLTLVLLLVSCSQSLPANTPPPVVPPAVSPGPSGEPPAEVTPVPAETPVVSETPAVTEEPVPTESPDAQPSPSAEDPVPSDPVVPTDAHGGYVRQEPTDAFVPAREAVDDSFFQDAAIVGNSLIEGLQMFSGISTCDYYAATSMSVLGVDSVQAIVLDNGMYGTIMQAIAQKSYAKVYILLGINEIGSDVGYFKQAYGKMLDGVRELQPGADIYIISITPVSYAKSSSSDIFNMTRVNAFNNALIELAGEKDRVWYLDVCEALAGPDGYLPAGVTSDGVHFSADQYLIWADYLRTHYV